ncbi:MAG: transketolase [Rhodocyclales bacterium]|nr:transketolase [Rhodocyclales bacterium]
MSNFQSEFENLARVVRRRLLRMHHESGVGHIGGNLSCLDALLCLHHAVLKESDVFVLSKGHAVGALYATLWSRGRLSDDDLRKFHGENTQLAAHPVAGWMPEIVFATGSLGHGLSLSAGLALGKRLQGQEGQVYCVCSDGEWQEGSTWEALIFAHHHQLDNLTVLVDVNGLQGFGATSDVASMADLQTRIAAFGVEVVGIDGHDAEAICTAARPGVGQPRFVLMRTVKGRGVSFMENRMEWHYLPLDDRQYEQALAEQEPL